MLPHFFNPAALPQTVLTLGAGCDKFPARATARDETKHQAKTLSFPRLPRYEGASTPRDACRSMGVALYLTAPVKQAFARAALCTLRARHGACIAFARFATKGFSKEMAGRSELRVR